MGELFSAGTLHQVAGVVDECGFYAVGELFVGGHADAYAAFAAEGEESGGAREGEVLGWSRCRGLDLCLVGVCFELFILLCGLTDCLLLVFAFLVALSNLLWC